MTNTQPTRATPHPQSALDRLANRVLDAVVREDAERGRVWRDAEAQKVAVEAHS